MRLKLSLLPQSPRTAVPINYNYPLSAALYKTLRQAEPEYAAWLHDRGYASPNRRFYKLFTFSRLFIPVARRDGSVLIAGDERPWHLLVSSPMEDDFVQNFVLGLFQEQTLEIGGPGAVGRFLIGSVEALPVPEFRSPIRGVMLSPLVCTTMREHNGKQQPYYFRPQDAGLSAALHQNLLNKYEVVHGRPCEDETFEIQLDMDYFNRKNGKVSKLLHIKEGTAEETRIKAFEMPFRMSGNPDLLRIAWECGLGDKNSLGLGMIEVR